MESYFLPETFQKSTIAIPEDFESREEMVKQSVKTNERAKQVTSRFEANFLFFLFIHLNRRSFCTLLCPVWRKSETKSCAG